MCKLSKMYIWGGEKKQTQLKKCGDSKKIGVEKVSWSRKKP